MTNYKNMLKGSLPLIISIGTLLILLVLAGGANALPGPIAEYQFNGNAQDSSGNNNHGTINGAIFVPGISGNALSFNGINDYMDIPSSDGMVFSAMTVMAFVYYPPGTQQERIIIGKHTSGTNSGFILEAWNNQLGFYVSGTPTRITTTENFDSGWHYVVGVYDNGNMKLYVDGILKASGDTSGIVSNDNTVKIGRIDGLYGWYFDGIIDNAAIYDRALSADEIRQQYNEMPSVIPEFPTITLPILSIIGLMFLFQKRKGK